jgi:hypothetical protein
MPVKATQFANLRVYSLDGVEVHFPYGGSGPYLIYGDSMARIEFPERFGNYSTPAERREWITRFVAAIRGR